MSTTELQELAARVLAECTRYGLERTGGGRPVALFDVLLNHIEGNHGMIVAANEMSIKILQKKLAAKGTVMTPTKVIVNRIHLDTFGETEVLRIEVPLWCVNVSRFYPADSRLPSRVELRIKDPKGRRDFEGSPCYLAAIEIASMTTDGLSWWPSLVLHGHIAEVRWADDVGPNEHDGGNQYMPDPLPDWKPGLYRVDILVGKIEPEPGEEYLDRMTQPREVTADDEDKLREMLDRTDKDGS